MTPAEEYNNSLVTNPIEKKISELPENEFEIMILRKFIDIQQNTDRQFHEIRKMICNMNEKFNKEIDIIKNQTVILQVKKINKIKSTIENFNSRLYQQKEESLNLKIGHLKLSHQGKTNKKRK